MIYRRVTFLLLISLLCSSCSFFRADPRKDFQIADRLALQYEQEMEKEGFESCLVTATYPRTIREFFFFYLTKKFSPKGIDQARDLIVAKVEQCLKLFNNNTYIRPYLHNFPFAAKNVTLVIWFINKNDKCVLPPYIAQVKTKDGIVYYGLWDATINDFEIIHKESYDRALSIYKNHQKSYLLKPNRINYENPSS